MFLVTLPQAAAVEVEDDPEKDPDYNVLASESEDLNETDDYKDDHGVRPHHCRGCVMRNPP